jgi:hypothetical protein
MKKSNYNSKETNPELAGKQRYAMRRMEKARQAMTELAQLRADHKVSNIRERGVVRELTELMKVMEEREY